MIKVERHVQPKLLHLPFAERRASEKRPNRLPWLRALSAGLAGLGDARVMPGALSHDRHEPATRNW